MNPVTELKKHLKRKILSRELEGCEAAQKDLFNLLKGTIETGNSKSVIVSGCPGSGKSTLVQNVLDEIEKAYEDRYRVIRLHGLFHSNDTLAFQDMSDQIDAGLEFCEDEIVSSDIFPKLFQKLKTLCRANEENVKTAVFVLEDFHLFQDSQILYFMFDTIRTEQVPGFVIGITTYSNILEKFEKRVKSRFSQLIINLNQSRTLNKKIASFVKLLKVEENACSDSSYVESWNESIDKLAIDNDVIDLLKHISDQSNDERFFTNFVFNSIMQLDKDNRYLTLKNLSVALTLLDPDYKLNLFKSLSTVQLCLMIAAFHQTELYNEPFNFEMIYKRYSNFARTSQAVPSVPKQMAYRAFETLVDLSLICPFSSAVTESELPEFVFHRLSISCDDIRDGIKTYPSLLGDIKVWIENSIS
ncbi:origin recognition complex subunit 4 [Planococcus citri]|uniref:origin recognition complex subunit 4 n=1 Tax=Planococcus citri TaxID=170843 RepID=UPI0031F7F59C